MLTVENVARNLTNAAVLADLSRRHGAERVMEYIDKAYKWLCEQDRKAGNVYKALKASAKRSLR